MLVYDGKCLTRMQIFEFRESMIFPEADGYSNKDSDRVMLHLFSCPVCRPLNVEIAKMIDHLLVGSSIEQLRSALRELRATIEG